MVLIYLFKKLLHLAQKKEKQYFVIEASLSYLIFYLVPGAG
ncbi:hypothetical protein M670_00253 [Schinkia azotoformans MEV2011]|uniref:Uncharacterized protein n=1 Tax=Schinkia azotoformans MEV2011 TaxID=1348973 RepID=A0A072NSN4_SCHAZ|nr:hypothetical protein M670_00253 [Schinkia azotoformans MEV2011]